MAKHLHLSQFEVHAAVQRLMAARLAVARDGKVTPAMAALRAFVVNGAAYAYPPVRGEITVGFPTAYAVAPLKDEVLFSQEMPPVWPHPEGTARGPALLPLYEKLPLAAKADLAFYELLALFDALRMGQARERALAARLLEERLMENRGMSTPLASALPAEIESQRAKIGEICARFGVRTLELFGSAASGTFDAARSDLDFMVEFDPARRIRPFEQYFGLKEELEALFERPVDLVEAGASSNRYFLESVNKSRRLLYAA